MATVRRRKAGLPAGVAGPSGAVAHAAQKAASSAGRALLILKGYYIILIVSEPIPPLRRDVQPVAVEKDGQRMFLLSDPEGICTSPILRSPGARIGLGRSQEWVQAEET